MIPPQAWKPDPLQVLDATAELGYNGISLGPPGYLGEGSELRDRLAARQLQLVEAFLPFHFSQPDRFADEYAGFGATLELLCAITDPGERPLAVLSEGFREPHRWGNAGRAASNLELSLPADRFPVMIDNIHRTAADCRGVGLTPVLHHHAGTYIETDAEIRRALEAIDPTLLGLCLDTAHAYLGGSDPVQLAEEYHALIRLVHIKDLDLEIVARSHAKEQDLTRLTIDRAFTPLGEGDADLAGVATALMSRGYQGWIVIEQDRLLFADDTFEDVVADQRHNLAFVRELISGPRGSAETAPAP
jgi:inosose dehydratase